MGLVKLSAIKCLKVAKLGFTNGNDEAAKNLIMEWVCKYEAFENGEASESEVTTSDCGCEKEICGICSQEYCDHEECKCVEWGMR